MVLLHCILISLNAVMVLSYSAGSKRGILEETDKTGGVKVKEFTEQVDAVRNLDDFNGKRDIKQKTQYDTDAENSDIVQKKIGNRAKKFIAPLINNISRGKQEGMQLNNKKKYENIIIIFNDQGSHHNINRNIDQNILVKDKKKDEGNIFDDQESYSGRRWFSMVYQLLRKYALGGKTSLVPIF